eukprot:scaffold55710_cov25-Tisochrysis_lutea.AAC.6
MTLPSRALACAACRAEETRRSAARRDAEASSLRAPARGRSTEVSGRSPPSPSSRVPAGSLGVRAADEGLAGGGKHDMATRTAPASTPCRCTSASCSFSRARNSHASRERSVSSPPAAYAPLPPWMVTSRWTSGPPACAAASSASRSEASSPSALGVPASLDTPPPPPEALEVRLPPREGAGGASARIARTAAARADSSSLRAAASSSASRAARCRSSASSASLAAHRRCSSDAKAASTGKPPRGVPSASSAAPSSESSPGWARVSPRRMPPSSPPSAWASSS